MWNRQFFYLRLTMRNQVFPFKHGQNSTYAKINVSNVEFMCPKHEKVKER